jgi:hypothetical protein
MQLISSNQRVTFLLTSTHAAFWTIESSSVATSVLTKVNSAPVISSIGNVTTLEETASIVSFTIRDSNNTLSCAEDVRGSATVKTLVPNENIVFSGTAPNCVATITPASGQSGLTTISFTVSDGQINSERKIDITVSSRSDSGSSSASKKIHLAIHGDGKVQYLSGNSGSWTSPSTVATSEAKPNLDWENISIAIDAEDHPFISYYSTASNSLSDGHLSYYQSTGSNWIDRNIVTGTNYNAHLGFVQGRFVSDGNMQMTFFNHSGGTTSVTIFDPRNLYSGQSVELHYSFNSKGAENSLKSCVDDHDRLWFANAYQGASTKLVFGYRLGSGNPSTESTYSLATFSTDPCQADISSSLYAETRLQDLNCRGGKLTFLTSCVGSSGYIRSLAVTEKDISSASTPNLNQTLSPTAVSGISSILDDHIPNNALVQLARTASGALRMAYGDLIGPYYFNGTTWSGPILSTSPYLEEFAFGLDSEDRPHIIFLNHDDDTGDETIYHWTQNGANSSVEPVYYAGQKTLIMSTEFVMDGMEGRSNTR